MNDERPDWPVVVVTLFIPVLLLIALIAVWGTPGAVVGIVVTGVAYAIACRGGLSSMMLQAGGLLFRARWKQQAADSEREMAQAVADVVFIGDEERAQAVDAEAGVEAHGELAASGEVSLRRRAMEEILRRRAIERLMTEAAEWGWTLAQMGLRTPPRPRIEWTDDGEPRILYGTSIHDSAGGHDSVS